MEGAGTRGAQLKEQELREHIERTGSYVCGNCGNWQSGGYWHNSA